MNKRPFYLLMMCLGVICTLSGCRRTSNDVWDDTKSAGRHMGRGLRALGGKHGHSRQVRSRDAFACVEDNSCEEMPDFQDCDYLDNESQPTDFIPLEDQANDHNSMNQDCRPSRESPGDPGSAIPGIQAFRDPNTIPGLSGIFRTIYFDYDSSLIKGGDNFRTLQSIAEYLRRHPRFYVFIEGHTDERGPQAYNLALGSRRSNAVRNILINEGVNSDQLFTISYGKERPVILERHEEGWAKNRRAEFKVYER